MVGAGEGGEGGRHGLGPPGVDEARERGVPHVGMRVGGEAHAEGRVGEEGGGARGVHADLPGGVRGCAGQEGARRVGGEPCEGDQGVRGDVPGARRRVSGERLGQAAEGRRVGIGRAAGAEFVDGLEAHVRVGVGGGGLQRRARGAGEAPTPRVHGVEADGCGRVLEGLPQERLAAGEGVGGEGQRAQSPHFRIAIGEGALDDRRRGLGTGHQRRHGQSPDPRRPGIGRRPLRGRRPPQQVPRARCHCGHRATDARERLEATHGAVDRRRFRFVHASRRGQLCGEHGLGRRDLRRRGVPQAPEGRRHLAPHFPQAQLGIECRALEQQRLHLRHCLGRRGDLRQCPGGLGSDTRAITEGRGDEPDVTDLPDAPQGPDPGTPLGPAGHCLAHGCTVSCILCRNNLIEGHLLRRWCHRHGLGLSPTHGRDHQHGHAYGQHHLVTSHRCAPE